MSFFQDICKMLLHTYLEEIFGSKSKVKILRTLFKHPSKIFTGRELSELTPDTSKSAVAEAINDLEAMNLVKIEHHGQSNLITLNEGSRIYGMLKNVFKEESETFNKFIENLTTGVIPKQIISIAIFGSVAEGTEKPNSDIDILFITQDKKAVEDFTEKKLNQFISRYGNVITPYTISKKELIKKKNTPFVKNVLKKYVLVYGVDLWKMLKQEK